ncbi:hypothetical protein BH11MYX3_BH11MYX3_10360 [soil metagenome]
MSLILDAGALIAIERRDGTATRILRYERASRRTPITHGGVVGQVWRGGSGRQAILAMLLPALKIVPLDERLGRRAGTLLARTGTSDVVDAAVVLLAEDGDWILTSDPQDLAPLVEAAGLHVDVISI